MAQPSIDTYLELPDGRTFVRDIPGPPGAPAVLLLHGLGATARLNWGPSFRPLSRHFRVIALDHRGHGRGLRSRRAFRLEDCADDAMRVVDAVGVDRLVAVGYSMGGPIASLLWQRHSARVDGLVLCATARHFTNRGIARAARLGMPVASRVARLFPGRARNRMVHRMLARIEHPQLRERVTRELGKTDPAAVMEAAGQLGHFSSHDWIGRIDVPTAVIVTTRDELVPPDRQRKMAQSIPGAEVFEVEGDHQACVARADLFVPTLVRACQSVVHRSARDG